MSHALRSTVPFASAAELGIRWAEVLSEPGRPEQALSLLWFGSAGQGLGRVLCISGVAPRPDREVTGFVRQLHDTPVSDSGDSVGLGLALSRRGRSSVTTADREWVTALQASLDSEDGSTRSPHVARSQWITTVVAPPAERFDPHRVARRPPAALLDHGWLDDQN